MFSVQLFFTDDFKIIDFPDGKRMHCICFELKTSEADLASFVSLTATVLFLIFHSFHFSLLKCLLYARLTYQNIKNIEILKHVF